MDKKYLFEAFSFRLFGSAIATIITLLSRRVPFNLRAREASVSVAKERYATPLDFSFWSRSKRNSIMAPHCTFRMVLVKCLQIYHDKCIYLCKIFSQIIFRDGIRQIGNKQTLLIYLVHSFLFGIWNCNTHLESRFVFKAMQGKAHGCRFLDQNEEKKK